MAIYPGIYDGPPRSYGGAYPKRYVAIHNTANDATAQAEADYAKRRTDGVSSHCYADAIEVVQSLDTALSAHHAGSTTGNRHAISYEITGTNGKSREWWLANVAWERLARQMAADCRAHGIEPRLLTVAQMRAGDMSGFVTHDLMRLAWGGTTHTDPGPGFPMDYLLGLVRAELEDDVQLDEVVYDKRTVRQILLATDARLNYLANSLGLASKLDAILAAARDDGDVTVQLPPEYQAVLQGLRDDLAAYRAAEAAADRARADVLDGPVSAA